MRANKAQTERTAANKPAESNPSKPSVPLSTAILTGLLMSRQDVRKQLGVSYHSIMRWTKAGKLPAVYLSARCVRYRPNDVQVFLNSGATGEGQ